MTDYRKLPIPDQYGNYWFSKNHISGPSEENAGPVIFPHKEIRDEKVVHTGKFSLLLGFHQGFASDQSGRRIFFKTAERALLHLQEHGV